MLLTQQARGRGPQDGSALVQEVNVEPAANGIIKDDSDAANYAAKDNTIQRAGN